jgi:hypothetical protein
VAGARRHAAEPRLVRGAGARGTGHVPERRYTTSTASVAALAEAALSLPSPTSAVISRTRDPATRYTPCNIGVKQDESVIIRLSATVSNTDQIAEWPRARLLRTAWRPIRLTDSFPPSVFTPTSRPWRRHVSAWRPRLQAVSAVRTRGYWCSAGASGSRAAPRWGSPPAEASTWTERGTMTWMRSSEYSRSPLPCHRALSRCAAKAVAEVGTPTTDSLAGEIELGPWRPAQYGNLALAPGAVAQPVRAADS